MKRLITAVTVFMLFILAACEQTNQIVQNTPDEADTRTIVITIEPTARPTPSCPETASFGSLSEHWPGNNTFLSSPEFTWFYIHPPNKTDVQGWFDDCVPDSYSLYLSTGPDFADEFEVPVTDPLVGYDITKITMDWNFDFPLEAMKTYRWIAVGHYGDIDIGMDRVARLHNDAGWTGQFPANKGSFRTGPMCDPAAIDIPALVSPADGETISTSQPKLTWNVTTCMPLVFITQLSRQPNLDALDPAFMSFDEADYTFRLQTNYPWLDMAQIANGNLPQLPDCTTYYWRVIGGVGDYFLYGTDRVWGQWSGVNTFYVNSGTCPTPTPRPTATYTPVPTNTPKPQPTAVDCSSFTTKDTCEAHSDVCFWYSSITTGFPAVCKKK